MSNHIIEKDNPKRWFNVQKSGTGADSLAVFGYVGPVGVGQLETGEQHTLDSYLTEDELEIAVDGIGGTDYYKDAVESGSDKFQGESGKYPNPGPPEPPEQ